MNTANTDLKFLTNSLVLASLPAILGEAKTPNWYDPCGLLGEDGPSELKPEFRERLRGGGLVSGQSCGCTQVNARFETAAMRAN